MLEYAIVIAISFALGLYAGSTLGANKRKNATDALVEYYEGTLDSLEEIYEKALDEMKAKLPKAKSKAKPAA